MTRSALKSIDRLLPASWRRWLRGRFGWQWFRGDHASWPAARAASAGYDDAAVLARVVAATREVRAGRARWERDGVAFTAPEVNAPLLAVLRAAAQESGGKLAVIDFGGALGSTWWQHREALEDLLVVQWRVVEQPHYAAAGAEFADAHLSFHDSIAAALAAGDAPVILLSSVLPYLEEPWALLAEVVCRGFRHVVIDRTPMVTAGRTRLAVQHTPPELGGGSYPCWLFEQAQLLAALETSHRLVQEWPALDELSPKVRHCGFHFRCRDA